MEEPSNDSARKHQSSPAQNVQDDPPNKRHKSTTSTTSAAMMIAADTCCTTLKLNLTPSPQSSGVLAAIKKLTSLVERHPHFHSKLEEMLEDVYDELEPEVSAAIRKEKNEESCPLYKLSHDEFKHIFGYVGEGQYRFVACTSYRFHQVHLESFGNETSMKRRGVCVLRSIVPWLGNASVL